MTAAFDPEAFPGADSVSLATSEASALRDAPAATPLESTQEAETAETAFDDEIEEELIIEDFTIDGICGVY